MMKLSEEERREYEAYLESLRYQASMFESSYKVGEKKGEKKGIELGEKKGKCDMAKVLKDNGVDIGIIIKSSGLSREEIEKL